ncbi:hypothetical protein [Clostridium cochlearium]|uniref:hypothetical protein n=1 Tax=Clostridium cochlearium TaxID=1494 RepID=UPI0015705A85|nr:hypothetical protein [Clostridium cochlearium]MBV1820500.1 hypothetical protein [Bacteroidales bacterium MSK.15.36]MCG4572771.1 hypothetical protein [Clostridium cochlearium]MCG4580700.1 hypothetical protein [Clostridium cochlearium]
MNIKNKDDISFFVSNVKYKINLKKCKNYNYANPRYTIILGYDNGKVGVFQYDYINKILLAPLPVKLDEESYKSYDRLIQKHLDINHKIP